MPNTEDYFNSKKFRNILNEYEENEKAGVPSIISSEDYIDIAEFYYNSGNVERALKVTDTAIGLYPGSSIPLLFKARIELFDNNDSEKAMFYAEQILDKTDLEYYYLMAEIMLTQNRAEDADNYLEERYAGVDDEDKEYYLIDVATIFVDYDELDIADKWFKRCKEQDLVEYKELKARLMMNRGEFEISKQLYQELIDNDPYSTNYWNSLASSQFFSNDIEESINSSEYSIAIDPKNAIAILNKANGLYNLGNYGEALKYYLRYTELCPDDDSGRMLIGLCHLLLEDFENAIVHLQKAAEMAEPNSPNLIDIYKDMAYALCRLDRVDEGMKVLDKTDELDCDHNEMLVYRGSLLLGAGRLNECRDYFMKALEKSGCKPDIFFKITITFYESGDIALAYKMFNVFYKYAKGWHKGYVYFAACCYDLGRYKEFLKYLKPAVKYTPDEAQEVLGVLFPKGTKPEDYYEYIKDKLGK